MKISVIVPALNAAKTLNSCLDAIFQQTTDVLVVDDGSTDATAEIARKAGARVFATQRTSGPGAARNLAAEHATGDILFFVDADVVIAPDAVERVLSDFEAHPQTAAVFGSYDDAPAEQNFLSQFKNLMHHYVHQESSSNAGTFWAGCGAVQKKIFHQVGGFDAEQYPYPSIEDIDLGIRIRQKGHEILLDKMLRGKHLKRWTVSSLLKADILRRALPWSKLIATHGVLPAELNLKIQHRVSGMLATLLLMSSVTALFLKTTWCAAIAFICLVSLLILNRKTYSFFLKKKGALFMLGAIFWHMLYYLYSTFTFAYCWIRYRVFTGKGITGTRMRARHSA